MGARERERERERERGAERNKTTVHVYNKERKTYVTGLTLTLFVLASFSSRFLLHNTPCTHVCSTLCTH